MTPTPENAPAPAPASDRTLATARALAFVLGGGAMAAGALGWGRRGLVAAAVGVALSLVNVWALGRMAARAVGAVSVLGAGTAATQLTALLGAKTVVLLTAVYVVTRVAALETFPFALGLLVTVVALLGAGLAAAAARPRAEQE